jgi:hypothetical protein
MVIEEKIINKPALEYSTDERIEYFKRIGFKATLIKGKTHFKLVCLTDGEVKESIEWTSKITSTLLQCNTCFSNNINLLVSEYNYSYKNKTIYCNACGSIYPNHFSTLLSRQDKSCSICTKNERIKKLKYKNFTATPINNSIKNFSLVCDKCDNHRSFNWTDSWYESLTCRNCYENEKRIEVQNSNIYNIVDDKIVCTICNTAQYPNCDIMKQLQIFEPNKECNTCLQQSRILYIASKNFTATPINNSSALYSLMCNTCNTKRKFTWGISNSEHIYCSVCNIDQRLSHIKSLNLYDNITSLDTTKYSMRCNTCNYTFNRLWDDIYTKGIIGCPKCVSSNEEKSLRDYVESLGYETTIYKSKTITEIDIYIEELKLGIEYNGVYYHTENMFEVEHRKYPRGQNYHKNKYIKAKEEGIQLLNFDSIEWSTKKEIVKSMLSNLLSKTTNKVYARNCEIRNVDTKTSNEFLDNNHIQGATGASIRLGLYYNDELVSLMCFTNKKEEYELVRFVSKLNTNVVGGASKLFKYFLKEHKEHKEHSDKPITSFSDNRWFGGGLYETLGFVKVHDVMPSYEYIHKKNKLVKYHKSNFMLSRIKSKYPNEFKEELTEYENMLLLGYDRIWDCGKVKWVYSIEEYVV